MDLVSIDHFLINQQRQFKTATGEFSELLSDITFAAKVVAAEVRKAGLVDVLGSAGGGKNVSGDVVQKLDLYAHEVFTKILGQGGRFAAFTSEESEDIVLSPQKGGKYIVHLDPLDGSNNIDVNVSVGTIFSIHKRLIMSGQPNLAAVLQPGKNQVCAGYVLYGSSVMLVYTTGRGVHGFTLNPEIGEFLLSHQNIKLPADTSYYSINEGYSPRWTPGIAKFVNRMKQTDIKARYIGSLVADIHRTLLKGGIFLYPADKQNPDGKLRLMFEANPMAMIVEQARGKSSNGQVGILNIKPTGIHQRTPLFLGNKNAILLIEKLLRQNAS
jgi:fructose-1,6-bisphosphatase I